MPYCFDIGGTNIRFGMPAHDGDVPVITCVPTPTRSREAFFEAVAKLVSTDKEQRHNTIAVALAGVVHPDTNRVRVANIPAIDGMDVAAELTRRTGLPSIVANDADCLALAEAKVGVAKNKRNVFAIVLGTGVGGGIVANGQIVVGSNGAAGEFGHGPVIDPTAGCKVEHLGYFKCGCGQSGCLDSVGGARGLEKLHEQIWGAAKTSKDIVALWHDGDTDAAKTIDVWATLLAGPIAMLVNLLGPDIVPVGGGLANAPKLIAYLDQEVRNRTLFPDPKPLLVPAKFARNAGLVGAAHLVAPKIQGAA